MREEIYTCIYNCVDDDDDDYVTGQRDFYKVFFYTIKLINLHTLMSYRKGSHPFPRIPNSTITPPSVVDFSKFIALLFSPQCKVTCRHSSVTFDSCQMRCIFFL